MSELHSRPNLSLPPMGGGDNGQYLHGRDSLSLIGVFGRITIRE